MSIDPQAMADYVNQQPEGEMPEGEEAEEAPEDDGEGKYAALLPLLEANAEEISECCDELDYDSLVDPEMEMTPEDGMILQEGYDMLPDDLRAALEEAAPDISMDEASSLADNLASQELIEDPERFAGWLFRVGEMLGGGGEEGDEEDLDEEDLEDDDLEDEELDDGEF